jgi:hypothetical protein
MMLMYSWPSWTLLPGAVHCHRSTGSSLDAGNLTWRLIVVHLTSVPMNASWSLRQMSLRKSLCA